MLKDLNLHLLVLTEIKKQQSISSRLTKELDEASKIRTKLETTMFNEARIAKKRAIQAAKTLSTTQTLALRAKQDRETAEINNAEATEKLSKAEKTLADAKKIRQMEPLIKARMEAAEQTKAQADKLLIEAEEIKERAIIREEKSKGLSLENKQLSNHNNEIRIEQDIKGRELKERERVINHRENASLEIAKDLEQQTKNLAARERSVVARETKLIDSEQDFKIEQLKNKKKK